MAFGPLVFGRPPAADAAIVFGEGSDSRALVRVSATLPSLNVSVEVGILAPVVTVGVATTLPGLTVSVLASALDWRDAVVSRSSAPWRDGAEVRPEAPSVWLDAPSVQAGTSSLWRDGTGLGRAAPLDWNSTGMVGGRSATYWRDGSRVLREAAQPWRDGVAVSRGLRQEWRQGQELRRRHASPWQAGVALAHTVSAAYGAGMQAVRHVAAPWGWAEEAIRRTSAPWRDGENLGSHGGGPIPAPVIPPVGTPCYSPDGSLVFRFQPATDGSVVFRCDHFNPGPAATTIVPIRKVYAVLDSFLLRRVAGNITLTPMGSASMSLDANSWTWALSFTLPLAELSLVEADANGVPVEVEATVNGVAYRMLAERVSRDRSFPTGQVKVECRGIGGALDALSGSYSNPGAIRSAAQIMGDILSVNGVGVGWSVDFGLTDWNIAAGQWAHNGTAISALSAVASAAGGYLQPHPTLKTLRVLPRYPVLPWDWAGAVPDLELPSAPVVRESIEWVEKPRYNRVYVAGQGQGVLCRVTRAGTAGDILAPQVVDPLIATAAAGRQRGGTILADTGRQALISLSLPILAETGIITPGKLIRYVDGSETRVGLTRSVNVSVNRAGSRQTIGIETHA